MEAYTYCSQKLPNKYVQNWFGARKFFGTVSTSEILKGSWFITHDKVMNSDIYSLRYVNTEIGRIDTIEGPQDSMKACQKLLIKESLLKA